MWKFLTIFSLIYGSAFTLPSTDVAVQRCDLDYTEKWPTNYKDLTWFINEQSGDEIDGGLSKFRLASPNVDLQNVDSMTKYNVKLESLDGTKMKRFLISITSLPTEEAEEKTGGKRFGRKKKKNCKKPGMLHSLQDVSERLSYSCPLYLIDKAEEATEGVLEVPFVWESPKCGCVVLKAEVVDNEGKIYTSEDDPNNDLSLTICVQTAPKWVKKMERKKKRRRMRKHQSSSDEANPSIYLYKEVEQDAITDTMIEEELAQENEEQIDDMNEEDFPSKDSKFDKKARKVAQRIATRRGLKEVPDQLLERVIRKKLLKRAKKICCKKGLRQGKLIKKNSNGEMTCNQVPDNFLQRVTDKAPIKPEQCQRTFQFCCNQKLESKRPKLWLKAALKKMNNAGKKEQKGKWKQTKHLMKRKRKEEKQNSINGEKKEEEKEEMETENSKAP